MNKVFISKGSAATDAQREFIDSVLNALNIADLDPRIMGENEWSHEQPLKAIKEVMRECDGLVVIAFTRMEFEKGIEVRKNQNTNLTDIRLPTPWNHIEAAMAYSFDLPVFIVAEEGLKQEGLLEKGYDWQVCWLELSSDAVKLEKFKRPLTRWKSHVLKFAEAKASTETQKAAIDWDKLPIGELIKSMPLPRFWKLLSALAALISGIAITFYKLGGGKWPWQ